MKRLRLFGSMRWARRARGEQARRAQAEQGLAETATEEADALAHQRRADRAAYLRDKLAERERSEEQ
jgi:hypothetical protein